MKYIRCSKRKGQAGLGDTKVMGGERASAEGRRKVAQKIKDVEENEWIRSQRRKKGKMWRDAVRDWEMERKGSEEQCETLPASQNGLPVGRLQGQLAAMAGDALQSPSPGKWNRTTQVVALRVHVTAHSETTSSKARAQDLSLKETAVGQGEEGPLWGSGSVFLLSEDVSAKPSSCLRSSCSVLAWFFSPSLTLLQKHIFSGKFSAADFLLSHLNSYFRSSYSFCFHALAVCIISLGIDEGKNKRRCQAGGRLMKKPKWSLCTTMGTPCCVCCRWPRKVSRAGWALGLLWHRTCCGHLWAGSGFVVQCCVYSRGNRELARSAGRFKPSYSCSEVVSQMTCLEDKNKGLEAHPQTWPSRDMVRLPSACPRLLSALERNSPGPASSLPPGRWCAEGGLAGPWLKLLATGRLPGLYQNRTPQRDRQISLGPTAVRCSALQHRGRKWIQF